MRRVPAPALLLAAAVVLAPLVTWLPVLTAWVPWFPLPHYPATGEGGTLWQFQIGWAALIGFLGLLVWETDRWLAFAVWLGAVQVVVWGPQVDVTTINFLALGSLGVVAATHLDAFARRWVAWGFVWAGAFQAGYCLLQAAGYDPLWGVFVADHPIRVLGTLGNEIYAAGFIAAVAPLAAWWLLPLLAAGIIATHSAGAAGAFAIAVGLKFRHWGLGLVATAPLVLGLLTRLRNPVWGTLHERLVIWRLGLEAWLTTAPTWGLGLGRFYDRCPALQQARGIDFGRGELWGVKGLPLVCQQAHNEWLQWVYETGLVGLVVLGGWLWAHRGMFLRSSWGLSALAVGLVSLTVFPFHMIATGLLGAVVVGCAMSPLSEEG